MKRTSLLLLAVALLCALSTGMALADEEISIYDLDPSLLATPEPPPANTYSAAPTLQPPATVQPERQFKDGSFQLVITAGGDMTIGGDVRKRGDSLFERELKKQGGDLNFLTRNVRDILLADDLTIVNFEGTLTTAPVYKTNNQFVFSAPPEYVSILRDGGIEAVALQNNHVMDHGETGLKDTKAAL